MTIPTGTGAVPYLGGEPLWPVPPPPSDGRDETVNRLVEALSRLSRTRASGVVCLVYGDTGRSAALATLLLVAYRLGERGFHIRHAFPHQQRLPVNEVNSDNPPLVVSWEVNRFASFEEDLSFISQRTIVLAAMPLAALRDIPQDIILDCITEEEQTSNFDTLLEGEGLASVERDEQCRRALWYLALLCDLGLYLSVDLLARLIGETRTAARALVKTWRGRALFPVGPNLLSLPSPQLAHRIVQRWGSSSDTEQGYRQILEALRPDRNRWDGQLAGLILDRLIRAGRWGTARLLCESQWELYANVFRHGESQELLVLSQAMVRLGYRVEEAESYLRDALQSRASDETSRILFRHVLGRLIGERAIKNRDNAAYEQAHDILNQGVRSARDERTELFFRHSLGYLELEWDDLALARREFEAVLRLNPANVPALVSLAMTHGRQGHYQEAYGLLARARDVAPGSPSVHHVEAQLLFREGNYQKAEDRLVDLIGSLPDNPFALHSLGQMLKERGHWKAARTAFERILEWDPSHPLALHSLGDLEMEQNNYEEAGSYFRKLLERDPGNVLALVSLAFVRTRQMAVQEATTLLNEAGRLSPENHWIVSATAELRLASGDPGGAEDELRRVRPGRWPAAFWNQLARIRTAQGRESDARAAYAEALDRAQRADAAVIDRVITRNEFAAFEARIGNTVQAEKLFADSYHDDQENVKTLQSYAKFLREQGRAEEARELEDKAHILADSTLRVVSNRR